MEEKCQKVLNYFMKRPSLGSSRFKNRVIFRNMTILPNLKDELKTKRICEPKIFKVWVKVLEVLFDRVA